MTSVYDDANRLTTRKFGGVSQTPLRIDLAYNDRNEMTHLTRYSDLAGSTLVGTTIYTRDDSGRLTNLDHKNGSGTVLASYVYAYDNSNRPTSETINGGLRTFSYDRSDQVTNDSGTNYTYDANGNRTMAGYQTGTANQLTNDGTWTYTYDDAGSITKKSKGTSLETWTYTYNHNNQLSGIEQRATDGGTLQLKVTYTYDAFGNRAQEEKWKTGVGTSTERYAYDGGDVWADLDNSNALVMRRFYGDGIDDVVARVSSGGTLAFYLKDRQGSVGRVVDSSGNLIGTMVYDGWGKVTSSSGSIDRYGYTGRERNGDTGLQYNRARYYDPATGRWLSRDPMGFPAGDPNLYRYVGNRVTIGVDPSGLLDLFSIPPQPGSGNSSDDLERIMKGRDQALAAGQTPPPLMLGSLPVYGSDGNQNAPAAVVEAFEIVKDGARGGTSIATGVAAGIPGIGPVVAGGDAILSGLDGDLLSVGWDILIILTGANWPKPGGGVGGRPGGGGGKPGGAVVVSRMFRLSRSALAMGAAEGFLQAA